jgi:hypothetical protein
MSLAAELSADSKSEQQNVFLVSQWKGVDEVVERLAPKEGIIRTRWKNKTKKKLTGIATSGRERWKAARKTLSVGFAASSVDSGDGERKSTKSDSGFHVEMWIGVGRVMVDRGNMACFYSYWGMSPDRHRGRKKKVRLPRNDRCADYFRGLILASWHHSSPNCRIISR